MTTPTDHATELLDAFKIGPDDLAANRAGTLSPLQRRRLAGSGTRNLAAALAVGVMLAAILAFVAKKPLVAAQVITVGVLFLAVFAIGVHDFWKTRTAARDGRVECLTGPIQVRSRGKAGWYLTVAGTSFRLPVHAWHLHDGATYRVYHAPRAGRVVALEPMTWR